MYNHNILSMTEYPNHRQNFLLKNGESTANMSTSHSMQSSVTIVGPEGKQFVLDADSLGLYQVIYSRISYDGT
jgi:hypothetical protein